MNWFNVYVQNYAGVSKTQVLSHDLDLSRYEEGAIYIRAIAKDIGGNTSDASVKAPYVQYIIDRTAPAKPQNVKAVGQCGYIEISWNQGEETDLNGYSVYRADAEDGEYVLQAKGLKTINYYDRTVTEGKVYYYIVAACDKAGNQSAFSEVVFSEVGEDTEAPVIVTIYPASGSVIGSGNNAVSVTATDNHMLQSLRMEYSADGIEYKLMYELPDISQYDQYADARIPLKSLKTAIRCTCGFTQRIRPATSAAPSPQPISSMLWHPLWKAPMLPTTAKPSPWRSPGPAARSLTSTATASTVS